MVKKVTLIVKPMNNGLYVVQIVSTKYVGGRGSKNFKNVLTYHMNGPLGELSQITFAFRGEYVVRKC